MSFDLLVSEVAANYAVDLTRVYLIGHASGTEAVDTFCRLRTDRIAAACMISSDGLLSPRATFPPLLLAHGWMDIITEAEKVEKLTRVAAARNIPVQFLGVDHYGHILIVGHALPSIVDFSHGSAPFDYDDDGDIDVFVNNLGCGSGIASYLLRNDGTGVFELGPQASDIWPAGRSPGGYASPDWSQGIRLETSDDAGSYVV